SDWSFFFAQEFEINPHEIFVLVTTDRTVLDFDKFEELQDGSTIYLLQQEDQVLPVSTEEPIMFIPHYDTLIRSGMYEYYASEGQKPLPYAFAELIDNALSATAKNTGMRTIELRMLFDESNGKPAVVVLDNGCGMTSKQLNNWAVYRLSKFTRANSTLISKHEGYVRPDPVPRSLNSDISYFGVGGKQAVFYIGHSARMISKARNSPDVHELVLSKEDFERKEKNREDIYSGIIRKRKPGDSSHVNNNDERFLHSLIAEEYGKESFTAVVITGILPEHITFLKQDFQAWTRELAHIYHYYIHGVNGNDMSNNAANSNHLSKIDIQVTLQEKPSRCPRVMNLREVDDDMQTLYINAAADTFEFKVSTWTRHWHGGGELWIRLWVLFWFLLALPDDEDDDNESGVQHQARGKRPIFECFWNGRLIPYTRVHEFDWCAWPIKGANKDREPLPKECYSRFSGVLFTDDRFQVSTNKLTFVDLELKMRNKETIFTRVVNRQGQRTNIQKDFTQWLKHCHENLDKQVKFLGFQEIITRTDQQAKKKTHPWATFSAIQLDGKIYKTGQLVKSQRTQPIHHGTVVRFLLYGNHNQDVFATGGQVEVSLEPKGLHEMTKIIPISKLDRTVSDEAIKKSIENDIAKLPHILKVDWPDGNLWPENAVCLAGSPFGPLKIEILNKKGESMSRMPTVRQIVIKLSVKLKIVQHGKIISHSPKYGFWFKKMENLTNPGKYTLFLNTTISDTDATVFGDRNLPSYKLKFTIKEGNAESFDMGVASSTLRVGVPFDIPLQLKDRYGNLTMPLPNLQPVLTCRWYFILQTYDLKVTLTGLKKDTQTLKISLLPGNPHSLHVKTKEDPIIVENGNPVRFNVEIHDEAGNITAQPKEIVYCQELPPATIDCSTGAGQLVTKPINLKIIEGEPEKLKRRIPLVFRELKVMPSSRVSLIKICSQDDENLVLKNNEKIEWLAGGSLENLFYKLYDEAGRAVPPTAEIASMIKVNWKADIDLKDLVQGKLPDIMVPIHVHEKRFYQVSYQDQTKVCIPACFICRPRPDEPKKLKATLLQNAVKLGETLSGNIREYELDHAIITFFGICSSSVEVTGICFPSGTPGIREICFTYQGYVASVMVKVNPGDPAELKLVSGPKQPLQVLNDHGIPTPFLVQVFDMWGNPSPDKRVVVELRSSPPALKVKGKASFTVTSVSGPKGYYQLEFNCSLNNKPIPGPSVNFTVLPDPNKPVSLAVEYNTLARFPAGGTFPVFFVTVVSDDGSPMTTFNPAAALMLLWEGVPTETAPQPKVSDLLTDRGDFYLDKEIPERAGRYTIQFSLSISNTKVLFSDEVVANHPVKLRPDSEPPAPVVSCSKDVANRTLVKNMTLRIMDAYGNPAGQDLGGKVVISITSLSGKSNIPLFEGKANRCEIGLTDGKVHITRLTIMENSPGDVGSVYTLLFKPEVPMVGHLACVLDDDAARVISWHIRGDMDCVITKTTEAAQRIYKDTQGRQQVMALDSIFVSPLNRPLPHIRNGHILFNPPGNPVYARDLLIYPHNKESCDIVFKNILGDTILIDDLDSGNKYRRTVVQNKIPCPTILTREGDRISGKGKFGGAQNKAPQTNTSLMFGAPLPQDYHTLQEQIDLLRQYRTAVQKRDSAEKERQEHLEKMRSPQMLQNKQDMEEKKKQLEEIERELGMFADLGIRADSKLQSFCVSLVLLLLISN
uniref:Structural maintenance of chromosomes flexible hinge domain containing 1 n=1 Tax=Lates calcarifer TaxID=8187 RepID=A0A4W6CK50_LATCA